MGRWWSLVSLSTRRNFTNWPSVDPATCTGACGGFPVVLASRGLVGSNMVFLHVIVGDTVSSDAIGNAGSGVSGLLPLMVL